MFYESAFRAADEAFYVGQVEATIDTRNVVCQDWEALCESCDVPPYLDGQSFQAVARVVVAFGGKVRQGK